jgi:hypothetical protein
MRDKIGAIYTGQWVDSPRRLPNLKYSFNSSKCATVSGAPN